MKDDLLITRTTADSVDSVCERLPEISKKHGFGVLGTHDLKAKMASKGVDFGRECRIFEVCNPLQAKKVLEKAMEVSTGLPCRISVYAAGGRTVLATIRPTLFLTLYEIGEAREVAEEVEETLVRIMDEAAGAT